ncbi:MAG TPA: hypothetical protein PLP48_00345 [Acholeplasmataceae bacterium]|nr:hypothetical protein [Acholeplasmataceae bacterium]
MVEIIVINGINIILLSPFIYYQIKSLVYSYSKNRTLQIVWRFGFLISLIGEIGAGKSSGQSALTHAFVLKFQQDIIDLLKMTKKVFRKLDFNGIDDYILERMSQMARVDFALIVDEVMTAFGINDSIIFNFLGHRSTRDYIKDYVFAIYALQIRNNYVYSVTKIYNRFTGNFNMAFDIKWQNIYDAYASGNYAIEDYAVELIDESSDDLASAFWRDFDKDESGAKTYRRKYRHIHQERNRIIDTRQDASDMVKKLRNLTQTNLLMEGVEFRNIYSGLVNLYSLIYIIPYKVHELFKFMIPYAFYRIKHLRNAISYAEHLDQRYGSINYRRNIDGKLLLVEWFVKSLGVVKFNASYYERTEDVGKKDPKRQSELELYFPASWCFGTYEQFAFKGIQDQLMSKSNVNPAEINIFFQPSFFNDITTSSDGKGVDVIDIT